MKIKDSGKRRKFKTGAQRDIQEGKGRYDLLPFHAIYELARVFEEGAIKYEEQNWRKGINLKHYLDSALRHLCKGAKGLRDEPHFAQAVWNLCCLIDTKYMIEQGLLSEDLDDLPVYCGENDPQVVVSKSKSKKKKKK